jgi:ABC-type lipoprotein export system ATPase subunit
MLNLKIMCIFQIRMYSEILQHLHFCRNFNKLFRGRQDILEKIRLYSVTEERNEPFVIYGPSGCGKSSILARTAFDVSKVVQL